MKIYESIHVKDIVAKDGEKYSIFEGLDHDLILQLKNYSLDKSDIEIQKTKDPKRFGAGSYEEWYKKNRTPFALVHEGSKKMAGLVFMGPEPLHEGCKCHTIGWRSYSPFRGKGLMKDFVRLALNHYLQKFPNVKFWAQIRKDNIGSLNLAKSLEFGLSDHPAPNGENFVIMTTYK